MMQFLHDHHVAGVAFSLARTCAWLFVLTVIFIPLEQLFAVHRTPLLRRSTLGDLGYYFISSFVPHLLLIAPLSVVAYAAYALVPWRVHAAAAALPLWASALAAFVIADLGFYWGHRLAHEIPFLWRFHALHHSPEHVYFLVSARAHPVDNAFIRLCGLTPIYILGLGAPESVKGTLIATLTMLAVTVWGFFIHANVRWRLGPLEHLLATPAFHHWHHTRSGLRDRNYASMLPFMDRLFGTHHLPAEWPTDYGIDDPLPASIPGQLLHPLRGLAGREPAPPKALEPVA